MLLGRSMLVCVLVGCGASSKPAEPPVENRAPVVEQRSVEDAPVATSPRPAEPSPLLTCEDVAQQAHDLAVIEPTIPVTESEVGDWFRRYAMLGACTNWIQGELDCFRKANTTVMNNACANALAEPRRADLTERFKAVDALRTKLFAAKKKPATITCARVAAAHYSDKKWQVAMPGQSAAERRKAIMQARKKMTAACTLEKWSEESRACEVVVDGGPCRLLANWPMRPWRIPTTGTECDRYEAQVTRLTACDKVSERSRIAVREVFQKYSKAAKTLPAEALPQMQAWCTTAADDATLTADPAGCP